MVSDKQKSFYCSSSSTYTYLFSDDNISIVHGRRGRIVPIFAKSLNNDSLVEDKKVLRDDEIEAMVQYSKIFHLPHH